MKAALSRLVLGPLSLWERARVRAASWRVFDKGRGLSALTPALSQGEREQENEGRDSSMAQLGFSSLAFAHLLLSLRLLLSPRSLLRPHSLLSPLSLWERARVRAASWRIL